MLTVALRAIPEGPVVEDSDEPLSSKPVAEPGISQKASEITELQQLVVSSRVSKICRQHFFSDEGCSIGRPDNHPAGWPLRLAGWAYEASGPNEAGLKSLVLKWAEKIEPNPI
ncbi:hypothetical protein H5410_055412 [Solanum commersonii]|uniref:Uncharacterized protein n=1 Tax=Solanum commersonii TaxID=4109 RepID=A0A9J5WK79_SOLCO|nr:hypothetical protein H5410_055412 [Solanum commersonii]